MVDLYDHRTHDLVPHAPRSVLRRQIARARAMGYEPMMATELEFFLFAEGYKDLFDNDYRALTPTARHNVDYALTGTFADEPVMRALRNGLYGAGIPVENSKGEAEAGQHEINVKYSDALDTADMHVLVKAATKEIAQAHGQSATFMAKYRHGKAGSSSHVHQSLFRDGANAFHDPGAEHGMSDLMRHYMAGQLAHAQTEVEIGDLTIPVIGPSALDHFEAAQAEGRSDVLCQVHVLALHIPLHVKTTFGEHERRVQRVGMVAGRAIWGET